MDFYDNSPEEEKALITAYLLVIWMAGLGGLEPPTSPLSGTGPSLYICRHHRVRVFFRM